MPSSPALGDNDKPGFLSKFHWTESTILTGYGRGSVAEGAYEYIPIIWHLGYDLRSFFARLEDHRGTLSFVLEPKINAVINPDTDVEIGISLGLKYRYPFSNKLSGYVLGTVGPHYISVETVDQADGFIFFNTIGAGVSFTLKKNSALSLEYRFRHISNAGISDPNNGIDSHMIGIGYTLFF
jgi:hypothetical protein